MRRFALIPFLAAAVALSATLASAATTIKFTTKQTSTRETAKGFVFNENVLRNGSKIGTDRGVCTYVIPAGSAQPTGAKCVITISLPGGRIVLSAKLLFDAESGSLKVTGGTGEYAGATGTGTYRALPRDRTAVTLQLA